MSADHYEPEWRTRKQRIDTRLRALGWRVVPFSDGKSLVNYDRCAVAEYPTDSGPADYALVVGERILGIVEAKKLSLGPQNVLTQAERYSRGAAANSLQYRDFHVPFLYSTNGEVLWFHDIRHPQSRSRKIADFHTPAALEEMLARDFDAACQKAIALPNQHPALRPYQREANEAVEQAIAERKRQMLVAMATGTGKTFTTVNQVYRLMKSGVGRRILFLVDRRALAAQRPLAFVLDRGSEGARLQARKLQVAEGRIAGRRRRPAGAGGTGDGRDRGPGRGGGGIERNHCSFGERREVIESTR